ncbi:MAG: zinc-ribbon domain containing protein [Nostoc sp. DedQUE12a]|nr:zinc-ribbon domain containing protein [Nostoc sp. DedQUE12a]
MSIKKKAQKTVNPHRKKYEFLQNKIKVNFAELSEASKRSWGIPNYYESYMYKCIACGKESEFPASLQQQWYEEKKKYFWMRPNKCSACYLESLKLRREIATFSELLKTSLTIPELTEMLVKLERFHILNNKNKFDFSLYNRIKKRLKTKDKKKISISLPMEE